MIKLFKNMTESEKNHFKKILKKYDFSIKRETSKYIEVTHGIRSFLIYSNDFDNYDLGISMCTDIELFLEKNYVADKEKSAQILESMTKHQCQVDEACSKIDWIIKSHINLREFESKSFQDDPIADFIYNITIKGKNYFIIDDNVFEGDPTVILSLITLTINDFLKQSIFKNLKKEIKSV